MSGRIVLRCTNQASQAHRFLEVSRLHVLISVLTICALFGGISADGALRDFTMNADGVCPSTGSSATGTGTFSLDTDTGEVSFKITLFDLTPTVMHVHGPADNCVVAVAAPALVFLPTGTQVLGTFTLDALFQELMVAGKLWFLAHTELHPAGEILGQIIPLCPNECSGNGTCEVGVCTCDPGWNGEDCSIAVPIPTVSAWGIVISGAALICLATLTLRHRIACVEGIHRD